MLIDMVGISARASKTGFDDRGFARSLDELLHMDRYEKEVILDAKDSSIGLTAYSEYPVRVYENEDYLICLEGRIYNCDRSLEEELLAVGHDALQSDTDRVSKWLLNTDGEFLLIAHEKESGRLALLNDAMGRLPAYYFHDDDELVFSRELRYLVNCCDVEFNKTGIAQYLLLGYSLGSRTLFENCKRLRPATLLTFDPTRGTVEKSNLHTFTFDKNSHADRSRKKNASELVSRFRAACRNRSGCNGRDIISLSGGLDSRSVLAGYHTEGISVSAATMASEAYVPDSDVEVAGQLADIFGVDWRTYRIGPPRGSDLDMLIKTKNGQVGLMTSFILEFFRQLREDFGNSLTYITGDGGDKVLPDLTPARSLSENELVDHIVKENSIMPLEQVAELTGLSESQIRQSIQTRLNMYPESNPSNKYTHYLVYERGVNHLFEGEDRNRFFFWSTTPFYSLPFFQYAMNCPSEQKARYKLYRSFLRELSPRAANQRHPDYSAPIDSQRHAATAIVDNLLSRYPNTFEAIKPIIRKINDLDTESSIDSETIDCIQSQVDQCEPIGDIFSIDELRHFLDSSPETHRDSIYRIFALTSLIDDLYSRESILVNREDKLFR